MVSRARREAGLVVREAAALVHITDNAWRKCEVAQEGASSRNMRIATFELFLLKTGPERERIMAWLAAKCASLGVSREGPTPAQVQAARMAAGHTLLQAAESVYYTLNAWQKAEDGREQGQGRMLRMATFELYLLKTGELGAMIASLLAGANTCA
jgi:hypothetical protein